MSSIAFHNTAAPALAERVGTGKIVGSVASQIDDSPTLFVRWVFYASIISLPFSRLYVPGTGDRVGVIRIVQFLLLCAVAIDPRRCIRLLPGALVWFFGYCVVRTISGLWLSPELSDTWWPETFEWIQFSLPWVWIAFNLLQYPSVRRNALWVYAGACSLCALLHVLGIGVTAVDDSIHETRSTVFGENANVVGATYALAIIALVGLGMLKENPVGRRMFSIPLIAILGTGMAKTGSRTALLLVAIGVFVMLFQASAFSRRSYRISVLLLLAVVLGAIVWREPTVVKRFREIDTQDIRRSNPRARMAPVLWEIFLRNPILGSGPDRYTFELTRRAMPYLIPEQRTIAAHNLPLLLLVETGIIGLVVFGIGGWKVLASAWRARNGPGGLLPLALILPFVIAGLVVSNPTGDHAFWFAVAYALAGAV